jgi:DNA-binding MarR family transcriptional regulator
MPDSQQANVYGDPNTSPARQLWLAGNAWHRMIRRALEPLGITHAQYLLLASLDYLSQREDVVTLRSLCRFAPMDENMASQVMKTLIDREWVERTDHPTDRRSQRLLPTESGRSKVAEAMLVSKPANAAFFEPLGERAQELAGMLFTLVAATTPDNEPLAKP